MAFAINFTGENVRRYFAHYFLRGGGIITSHSFQTTSWTDAMEWAMQWYINNDFSEDILMKIELRVDA
jgi:hypothetical protein